VAPKPCQLIQNLAQRIGQIEARCRLRSPSLLSLGIPALDALSPDRQLPDGSLIELLSDVEGAGAWSLGLLMANQVCGGWKTFVVIDGDRSFYPPAAAGLGLDLNRFVLVRPLKKREAFLAANQALRCSAVGAVLGWYESLSTLDARRLQLAAEAGGGIGLLLRPSSALRVPSFANLRLLITPVGSTERRRRLRIDVIVCRGGKSGQSMILEISDETGLVCLLPEILFTASVARPTRASG
jgi:protein ImuA